MHSFFFITISALAAGAMGAASVVRSSSPAIYIKLMYGYQHVQNGCILVNGDPTCANGPGHTQVDSPATIDSMFGDDSVDLNVYPGCEREFFWPDNLGDVWYGTDNCLYDDGGTLEKLHRIK